MLYAFQMVDNICRTNNDCGYLNCIYITIIINLTLGMGHRYISWSHIYDRCVIQLGRRVGEFNLF